MVTISLIANKRLKNIISNWLAPARSSSTAQWRRIPDYSRWPTFCRL